MIAAGPLSAICSMLALTSARLRPWLDIARCKLQPNTIAEEKLLNSTRCCRFGFLSSSSLHHPRVAAIDGEEARRFNAGRWLSQSRHILASTQLFNHPASMALASFG